MNYRKVDIQICRKSGYGHYQINAMYKGKEIKVTTTNSECFDWLNDDSNKEKHKEAKQYAYSRIVEEFNNLKNL